MELELKKEQLSVFEIGGEATLTQEETAETIVPDYCPDIARIILTTGSVSLHGREIRDGKAELTGTIHVRVLYTPEGDIGIRGLSFALPFTAESDPQTFPNCTVLTADLETELLEARMMNPRKVFTHCKLVSRITGYRPQTLELCTDVLAEPTLAVEKQSEQHRAILLKQITEKDFTFTEEITLSPGKGGAAELLTNRVTSTVTENKIVGSKLIFKGIFSLELLYRTAEGACCSTTAELPFSQIMDVEGAQEETRPSLQLTVTGSDLQLDTGTPEGRQVSATLYLHATALLREERSLSLLSDLYSLAYALTYDAEPLQLTSFCEMMTRRQTAREVLEIGVVADEILSVSVHCGPVTVTREGENPVLRTVALVRALYLDEGGVPLVAERGIDTSCQMELPENCQISAWAESAGEAQGSLGDRGIEVRFQVEFHAEASARVPRACITGVHVDMETPLDTAGVPSLVLRRLQPQETIWDLAKQYHSTTTSILLANQAEEPETLSRDQILLIPRKRV